MLPSRSLPWAKPGLRVTHRRACASYSSPVVLVPPMWVSITPRRSTPSAPSSRNKSHSAAYAYLAYVTAYLKSNYPVEFMSALLTSETGNTAKVVNQLPSRVTFILAEEGARGKPPPFLGVTCTFSAPEVTCTGPPLVQDDYYVVRIIVQVNADAKGGNLVDLAFVNPLGEVVESNYNNNMDKVKVKVVP